MHNTGVVQPHKLVETYATNHVLWDQIDFISTESKNKVIDIVNTVLTMESGSTEQNKYLHDVLYDYYFNQPKYEMILLVRALTVNSIMITYKNVPFFLIVVRDYSKLVRDARNIGYIDTVTH